MGIREEKLSTEAAQRREVREALEEVTFRQVLKNGQWGEEKQGLQEGETFLDFYIFFSFFPRTSHQRISWSLVEALRAEVMVDSWHNM